MTLNQFRIMQKYRIRRESRQRVIGAGITALFFVCCALVGVAASWMFN